MAAVDGWVNDVDDVLSKAEHSYRQITDDTTTDEKRMLLAGQSRCPFNPNQEIASRTTN